VIHLVQQAGGITSLAHPGLTQIDGMIPELASVGLAALEVRHSDHDAVTEQRYRELADRLDLAVSGGSDFHGDSLGRASTLGGVTLAPEDFAALESRAR
jgi:predicted metal-dependent phosphoesterase TrpH